MSETQLLIGLPKAGKTTFLAAVWHVAETSDIPGALRVRELGGDWAHLENIRRAWSNCAPLERTALAGDAVVSMTLEDPVTQNFTEVFIPDLSGESFELQWTSRKCTTAYRDLATQARGLVLCVHPNVRRPLRISEVDTVADEIFASDTSAEPPTVPVGEPTLSPVSASRSQEPKAQEWKPAEAPTQVQLVELLQFLSRDPLQNGRRKVAIVISAWDLGKRIGLTPTRWLEYELPLLQQYLVANPELFAWTVYGVSAQGGDLENDRVKLQRIVKPSERIEIVGQDVAPHDITAPIKWLMT